MAGELYIQDLAIPGSDVSRGKSFAVQWVENDGMIRDYAHSELMKGRYPSEEIILTFDWKHDDIIVQMLGLEFGKLVLYKDTLMGARGLYTNEHYRVVAHQHNITIGATPFTTVRLRPAHLFHNIDKMAWDDFNRANATGDLGTTPTGDVWLDDSQFDVTANKAAPNVVDAVPAAFDLSTVDVKMQVSISGMVDTDRYAGVVFRYANATNLFRAYVRATAGSRDVVLEKLVAGVLTTLATATWVFTATAELRVVSAGNRHRVWVDRRLYLDVTDSALSTNTKVGLYGNATLQRFDNFSVIGLSA